MRTTIDIPDELLRQAKACAALRGIRLKDFVTEAIQLALIKNDSFAPAANSIVKDDRLVLSDNYSFPLIRGKCGPAMGNLNSDCLL